MKYEEYRKIAKTGDVILFSGWSPASLLIRLITWSLWSHIGSVARITTDVFCWESTKMTGKDGVQISLLSNRIATYKGRVGIRRLHTRRDNDFYWVARNLRHILMGVKYELKIEELIGSALPYKNKWNLTTIFCSELKAFLFMCLGILKSKDPPNE